MNWALHHTDDDEELKLGDDVSDTTDSDDESEEEEESDEGETY